MYTDLLTRALGENEEEHRSEDLLLADLVETRARLRVTGGATPVAEALARELTYDSALIRLCTALHVRATPEWFECPERERARLEHELLRRGILLPSAQLVDASRLSLTATCDAPAGVATPRPLRAASAPLQPSACPHLRTGRW
jgi:hypothetical protein